MTESEVERKIIENWTCRTIMGAAAILATTAILPASISMASAEAMKIRISIPAVDNDWHAKMLTVFKDTLEKSAPGEFNVEIHLNATLFKQGTEVGQF